MDAQGPLLSPSSGPDATRLRLEYGQALPQDLTLTSAHVSIAITTVEHLVLLTCTY